MTLVQKTFDGQPSGTDATTSNTGASSVNTLNGGTVKFDSTVAARGSACGIKMVATATNSAADIRFALTGAGKYAFEFVWTSFATLPTVDQAFLDLRIGTTHVMYMAFTKTGQFEALDSSTLSVAATTVTFAANTKYRVALLVDNTGGAGAAKVSFNIYTPTGTSSLGSGSTTTANLSTGNITELRLGNTTYATGATSHGFDDVQWSDGATAEIGPMTAASPPTVITNDRALFVIDKHGSTSNDAGTLTYSITQTSGTATTATLLAPGIWGVVQSTTEDLVYTVTVADSVYGSVTSTDTVPMLQQTGTESTEELYWDPTANGGIGAYV